MQTKITSVALYAHGATVTRSGVPDGETVTVAGLPADVTAQSLRVSASGGRVLGCRLYPNEQNPEEKEKLLALKTAWDTAERKVEENAFAVEFLRQNVKAEGNTETIERTLAYVGGKLAQLLAEKATLRVAADAAKEAYRKAEAKSAKTLTASVRLEGKPTFVTLRYDTSSLYGRLKREIEVGADSVTVRLLVDVSNGTDENLTAVSAVFSTGKIGGFTALPTFEPNYIGRPTVRVAARNAAPMMLCAEAECGAVEEETAVDVTYTLDAVTVPENEHTQVLLQSETLPATFGYVVPAYAEAQAYYFARLDRPIDGGTAAVYYEGRYLGESSIPDDACPTFGLGVADRISVKRTEGKRFSSQGIIKGEKTTYGFTIVLRNDRAEPVTLDVIDRLPVSTDKSIAVDLNDAGGAKFDPDTGRLDWTVSLGHGKEKTLKVAYTVKKN